MTTSAVSADNVSVSLIGPRNKYAAPASDPVVSTPGAPTAKSSNPSPLMSPTRATDRPKKSRVCAPVRNASASSVSSWPSSTPNPSQASSAENAVDGPVTITTAANHIDHFNISPPTKAGALQTCFVNTASPQALSQPRPQPVQPGSICLVRLCSICSQAPEFAPQRRITADCREAYRFRCHRTFGLSRLLWATLTNTQERDKRFSEAQTCPESRKMGQ